MVSEGERETITQKFSPYGSLDRLPVSPALEVLCSGTLEAKFLQVDSTQNVLLDALCYW